MKSYITALITLTVVLFILVSGPVSTHISLRYYDSVLHLVAGIGLGFFCYAIATSFASLRIRTRTRLILYVLVCGVVWELFEIYFNIAGYELWTRLYYLDTAKDLALDVVGGAIVALGMIKKDVQ